MEKKGALVEGNYADLPSKAQPEPTAAGPVEEEELSYGDIPVRAKEDQKHEEEMKDLSLGNFEKDELVEILRQVGNKIPGGPQAVIELLQKQDASVQKHISETLALVHESSEKFKKAVHQSQIDEKFHWNNRFQKIFESTDERKRIEELASLSKDFNHTARTYGQIIIAERYLPVSKKTIKPMDIGGIAGGQKYIVQGILFKFAVDVLLENKKWLYGGDTESDENAAKGASHELKGLNSIITCNIPQIRYPLLAIVDYRGFRMSAISLLPIQGDKSLLYGSCDAGRTIKNGEEAPEIRGYMESIGKQLNLKKHQVKTAMGEIKEIFGPADIEVHRGGDGRYYMLDYARLMPPQARSPGDLFGVVFYRLMRPEFLREWPVPLSSDAFSGFGRENERENNQEVLDATRALFNEKIPLFASSLREEQCKRITEEMHKKGINMRHIGYVRHYAKRENVKQRLLFEMVCRTISKHVTFLLRQEMKIKCISAEEPYRIIVKDLYNKLIEPSCEFWYKEYLLKKAILEKFGEKALTTEERNPKTNLRDGIDIPLMFKRLEELSGIVVDMDVLEALKDVQRRRGTFSPFVPSDISIAPTVKEMDLIASTQGLYFLHMARQKTDKEKLRLLKQGEEHFREAAELNPGDLRKQLDWIRILSRLCRLVNQLVDGSSGADREELLKEADKIVNRSFELCTNLLAKIGEKENMDLVYLSSKIWLEKAHLQRHRFSRKSSLEFMMDGFNFIKLSLSKWVECGAAPPEKSFSSPKHKSSLTKLLNIIQESLNYILNKRLYPELAKSAADLIERCLENSSLQLGEENLFLEYISIPRNLWALVLLAGGRPHLTKHLTKAIRLRGITRFEGVYRENKQLNLCEEVTNASLKSLAEVCPDLEELELRKCYELTDEGINNLLQNCKKIRNLDLSGCWRLTDESLKSLSNVLTGLTVLNLSECLEISDVGIIHLASGKSKSTITSLNLNDLQKITNEGLRHIAEFHQLEELHLYSCKGFSDEPWAKICQGCPQLKILDLKDANTLTSQALKAVATCSQIRELDLGGLMEINDEGLEFIANGLPKLEKIDLNFCWRITDAGVMKLASLCHELQSIILDDCMEVTDESLKLLGKTCQKLEVVSLYNCRRVTDTGVKRIIRHCNNLKSLNLAKCKNITNALLKSISKYPSGKSLESLNLRSCDQIRDEGLKYLSKACVNLKSLILWNCKHVSDEGIRIISEGCHDLEELNTQGLLISDDSMQPLAKGCPKLKTLVIVKCNKVTDIGIKFISKSCHDLQKLEANYCDKTTDTALRYLGKGCPKLQSLTLFNCKSISDTGVKEVADHCPDLRNLDIGDVEDTTKITDGGLRNIGNSCPLLESINLQNCKQITTQGLKDLMEGCCNLKKINLKWCDKITDMGIKQFVEGPEKRFMPPALEELNIWACKRITDVGIRALPPSLLKLDCSDCSKLTDAAFQALPRGLRKLWSVRNNNLTDKALANLPTSLRSLNIAWCRKITDRGLKSLPRAVTSLRVVELTKLTDNGMQYLPKSLRSLDLGYTNISDEGLKYLPPTLQKLWIVRCFNITNEGLRFLPPSLRFLDIGYMNITDPGLKYLPQGLQQLWLVNLRISDQGLQHLPRTLQLLDLGFTQISDTGLKYLPPSLIRLWLVDCPNITDEGLQNLQNLISLELLDIGKNHQITDKAIPYLPRSIRKLWLVRCFITDEGMKNLPPLLRTLDVGYTNISDEMLKYLPKSMLELTTYGCSQVTDAGLETVPPTVHVRHD